MVTNWVLCPGFKIRLILFFWDSSSISLWAFTSHFFCEINYVIRFIKYVIRSYLRKNILDSSVNGVDRDNSVYESGGF